MEQFFVTASKPLNLMPVQCFTLSDGSCGAKIQAYFSIAALLHVIGQPVIHAALICIGMH